MKRKTHRTSLLAAAAMSLLTAASSAAASSVTPPSAAAPVPNPAALPVVNHAAYVAQQIATAAAGTSGPFQPNWESLAAYKVPDWFRDAKFGIFIHWGVYSVPGFANEWYPRNMYLKGNAAYEYHRAVYGPQSKFGYKDFIPMFKAEKFDPSAWIDLFVRAGARYVVPVAEHCDGFAMYDSGVTDWNAAKMGPKRDVVGELAKAARARGLHFGVSSHRAEHWFWYDGGRQFDSDINDARYAGLYGPAAPEPLPGDAPGSQPDPSHLERWLPPTKAFLDDWFARSVELVDKYHPDFIYFDWWINHPAFAPYLQRFAAYFYDEASKRGQGPVLTYKEEAFPPAAAVLDIERGKLDMLRLLPWETDTSVSVNSWGYVKDDKYKTAKDLITTLVDVVSKNGDLLLNVGPRPDGTIPEQAQAILLQIGAWLKVNGEAIYGTRPWILYGEGSTDAGTSEKKEVVAQSFTPADIRFVTKGDVLYALGLAPPKDGRALIKTLYAGTPYLAHPVGQVSLLGTAAPIAWEQTPSGLVVHLPAGLADLPYALRIIMKSGR